MMTYKLLRQRHLVELELVYPGGGGAQQRGSCEQGDGPHDGCLSRKQSSKTETCNAKNEGEMERWVTLMMMMDDEGPRDRDRGMGEVMLRSSPGRLAGATAGLGRNGGEDGAAVGPAVLSRAHAAAGPRDAPAHRDE